LGKRYRKKTNSGAGSYGEKAAYKAEIINEFVKQENLQKIVQLGCGGGNQLKKFFFPKYIWLDVSPTVVKLCKDIFREDATKQFFMYDNKAVEAEPDSFHAELIL
jgi:hypothetical protein